MWDFVCIGQAEMGTSCLPLFVAPLFVEDGILLLEVKWQSWDKEVTLEGLVVGDFARAYSGERSKRPEGPT